jgi:ABC-type Mn2+/Zn2+ transport system permease subunit
MLVSFLIGSAATVIGLWISWHAATAAGATIAATAVGMFFVLLGTRRVTTAVQRRRALPDPSLPEGTS